MYKLNLGAWNSVFAVPSSVVDDYIKTASGDNIKILLFLLRNSGRYLSADDISSAVAISTEQVSDSLLFWKQRGIIDINGDDIQPSEKPCQPRETAERRIDNSSVKRVVPDFMPKEIARKVKGSDEADYLFKRCEAMYGRTLTHNEQNTLMIILEDVCMPVEVAMIMLEYCFSIGKATPSYLRSLASDWMDKEINSIDKAESLVLELKNYHSAESRFRKMFEMTSAFSKAQKEMISTWVNTYGFSDEMINEAYQITLDSTGKLAFPYMNKILSEWHEKGINAPTMISRQKPKKEAPASSFDVDEIEKLIAKKYD